jgi:hypothetical protein
MNMIEIREPLRIASQGNMDGVGAYVLPVGTVFYKEKVMPEGQTLYRVYFYHKGLIAHENLRQGDKITTPMWLHNLSRDEADNLFKQFPLSREDVLAAVEANKITRDDLVDILRSLPE